MRVESAEIGIDVGALVVDTDEDSVIFLDPRLSTRAQVRLLADLLDDEEFLTLVPPLLSWPQLSVVG